MKKFFKKNLLLFLIGMIIQFWDPGQAYAVSDMLDVNVRYGFGGYFKLNTPTPQIVEIKNNGGLFDGWVLSNHETWVPVTYYTQAVRIPPGGYQRLEFASFGCARFDICEFPVEIYSPSAGLIKKINSKVYPLNSFDTLLVHIGHPNESIDGVFRELNPGYMYMSHLNLLPGASLVQYPPRIFPVIIQPDELPENPLLMGSVSTIAITLNDFVELEESHRSFLRDYVTYGGKLLIYFSGENTGDLGEFSDVLLPVRVFNETHQVRTADLYQAIDSILPENINTLMSAYVMMMDREISGTVLPSIKVPGVTNPAEKVKDVWLPPANYILQKVEPAWETDIVVEPKSGFPLMVSKNIGTGITAFASFDPFSGNPDSHQLPILMLAGFGILDPVSPIQVFSERVPQEFRNLQEKSVASYFEQGVRTNKKGIINWMASLSTPVLIYLIGFPILAAFARKRGATILIVLIFWSVALTVVSVYYQSLPISDKARINRAGIFWVDAGDLKNPKQSQKSSTRYYSHFNYGSNSSYPRSLGFEREGAIVDEVVDPYVWPYESVTIEQGTKTRLLKLPLETVSYNSAYSGWREFIAREKNDVVSVDGYVETGKNLLRIKVGYEIPFDILAGKVLYDIYEIWLPDVPLKEENSFEIEFFEDENKTLTYAFGGKEMEYAGMSEEAEKRFTGPIKRFWELTESSLVKSARESSVSRISKKPSRGYLMLATVDKVGGIEIDAGKIEEKSLTIIIISLPVYETE